MRVPNVAETSPLQLAVGTNHWKEIGCYSSYAEAQAAVDKLSDARFPVERVSIVADGLRFVEHVLGRRGYVQAMSGGAITGALIGAVLGFVFGLFDWVEPLVSGLILAVYGLFVGAIAGVIAGGLGHFLTAGQRDFSSVSTVQADRYTVLCEAESVGEAQRVLAEPDGSRGR